MHQTIWCISKIILNVPVIRRLNQEKAKFKSNLVNLVRLPQEQTKRKRKKKQVLKRWFSG